MDGYATVAEIAAERRSSAEVVLLGTRDADRSGARAARPETPPVRWRRKGRVRDPLAPPPPDTVVVVSLRHAAAPERREDARGAPRPTDRHAAEAARLAEALRGQKEAHAAEIERLRAEHAAGLRRLVEAHWRAQDAARTGAHGCACGPGEGSDPRPEVRSPARPPHALRWLARITRRG